MRAAGQQGPPGTLGAVLYANPKTPVVPESDWVELVAQVAAGDARALRVLVEASYRIVFTLAARITASRHAAEEVAVNVFHDVWRHASRFDPTEATVIAWIMNRTRSRAFERLQRDMQLRAVKSRPAVAPEALDALSSEVLPLARLCWRVDQRISAGMTDSPPAPAAWAEPEWEQVAPQISCKLLANDLEHQRISMLVRLAPGGDYPPHSHAGVEELHLLHGELWIDDRKLVPGDYNRAQPGTSDQRVWSETGCTCVLITSTQDELSPPGAQGS